METNFTVKIKVNGQTLDLLYYVNSQLESLSEAERLTVFNESFFAMENNTIHTIDGNGRISCSTWDELELSINQNDNSFTETFTKDNVNSDLVSNSYAIGDFIEEKYQILIQN